MNYEFAILVILIVGIFAFTLGGIALYQKNKGTK